MWDTFQQESFLVGAALVLIYQAAKFGEMNLGDPVTSRYVTLLPGARVQDFAGPHEYHLALAAFLAASLAGYFLCCQISPTPFHRRRQAFRQRGRRKAHSRRPLPAVYRCLVHGPDATDHPRIVAVRDRATSLLPRSDRGAAAHHRPLGEPDQHHRSARRHRQAAIGGRGAEARRRRLPRRPAAVWRPCLLQASARRAGDRRRRAGQRDQGQFDQGAAGADQTARPLRPRRRDAQIRTEIIVPRRRKSSRFIPCSRGAAISARWSPA
jgi:hypothetical protein